MAKSKDWYWISNGRTESGDDLPLLLWNRKPTEKEVEAEYRERLPEEFEEVGFVHFSTDRAEKMW